MKTDCNDGYDPRGYVCDVKDLVPKAPEEHGREDGAQEREAGYNSGDLLPLGKDAQQTTLAVEEGRVHGAMKNHLSEHGVASDLVKAVESLIRICRYEGQGSVFESQKYDQDHVR